MKSWTSGKWNRGLAVEESEGKGLVTGIGCLLKLCCVFISSDLHISDDSFLESLLRNPHILLTSLSIIPGWVKNNTVRSKQEDLFPGPEEDNVDNAWQVDLGILAELSICAAISLKGIHLMFSTSVEEQTLPQAP